MRDKYCESSAIGMGAPKCSEDCCDYGSCHKGAYSEHISKTYSVAEGNPYSFVEWKSYPHVECDSHSYAEGLVRCVECGTLVSGANPLGRTICSNCKRKKTKIARMTNYKFVVDGTKHSNKDFSLDKNISFSFNYLTNEELEQKLQEEFMYYSEDIDELCHIIRKLLPRKMIYRIISKLYRLRKTT